MNPARFAAARSARLAHESPRRPQASSLYGLEHNTSRVFPATATEFYPYSTVGIVLFEVPDEGTFFCSASVVGPRVIATAGHCVFDPTTGSAFFDFLFVPAFFEGVAPLGAFAGVAAFTTKQWTRSDGSLPNRADIAFIALSEEDLTDLVTVNVGQVTGWLGFSTNSLFPSQITQLGYSGDIDGGGRMQQNHPAGAIPNPFGEGSVMIGSAMTGGSSGGPWVANFGERGDGQFIGMNGDPNRVVAVTSWGFQGDDDLIQGASVPGKTATKAFKKACNRRKGNCVSRGKPRKP